MFFCTLSNFLKVTLNWVEILHTISKTHTKVSWIILRNLYISMYIGAILTQINSNLEQDPHIHVLQLQIISSISFYRVSANAISGSICCWFHICSRDQYFAKKIWGKQYFFIFLNFQKSEVDIYSTKRLKLKVFRDF